MNFTLFKTLVGLVPASILFSGSIVFFCGRRKLSSFLQSLGTGCIIVVVLANLCEAIHLLPWMRWGSEHSIGHYLDLVSAISGLTLFPIGYLLDALTQRHA